VLLPVAVHAAALLPGVYEGHDVEIEDSASHTLVLKLLKTCCFGRAIVQVGGCVSFFVSARVVWSFPSALFLSLF
jgi:hypothetical protein